MREHLLRGAVLAYALLLWLSVWPFEQAPLLGDAQRAAERLLARASLYAGIAVFPGHADSGVVPWVACTRVLARSEGRWDQLYTPTCPREGTLIFENSLDVTISRMLRLAKGGLLQRPLIPRPGQSNAVRNVFQLNDYFCRARPGIDRVRLRWVQTLRNYETGVFIDSKNVLVCLSDCDGSGAQIPHCTYTSVDRGNA